MLAVIEYLTLNLDSTRAATESAGRFEESDYMSCAGQFHCRCASGPASTDDGNFFCVRHERVHSRLRQPRT